MRRSLGERTRPRPQGIASQRVPTILAVVATWPPEPFIRRHAQALEEGGVVNVEFACVGEARERLSDARCVSWHRRPILILPDFNRLSLMEKWWDFMTIVWLPQGPKRLDWRLRVVARLFGRSRPDLIHFHFGSLAARFWKSAVAAGVGYTTSVRGSDVCIDPMLGQSEADGLGAALRRARGIHVVCDEFRPRVIALAGCDVRIRCIRTVVETERVGARTGFGDGSFVSVGRLHWVKGYHDLVCAMRWLPEARLSIVGEGPDRDHLAFLIGYFGLSGRVQLLGAMDATGVRNTMRKASFYVQASLSEGFSNALAEAMMDGMPVFATDVGGTSEVVRDDQNGILMPAGDALGMSSRLRLAKDEARMNRLGWAARETAIEHFGAVRHVRAFREFFDEALTASGA